MKLFKKLSDQFVNEKYRLRTPVGLYYDDIEQFESMICEEHSASMRKYEETNNADFADIAIDCLVTINELERLKLRMSIKNRY